MSRAPAANPMGLMWDCWQLGFEAWQVIGLRSLRMMQGGAVAQREASRMVTEKWQANMDLGLMAFGGGLTGSPEAQASKVVSHYGKRVSANRRRLTR